MCSNVILFLDYIAIPEMPLTQATVSFNIIQCCKCKAVIINEIMAMLKAKTHRNVNISAQMDLIVLQWLGE